MECVFYVVIYSIGWTMLKALTLGRYPPPAPREHNEEVVAAFPIVVAFAAARFAFS